MKRRVAVFLLAVAVVPLARGQAPSEPSAAVAVAGVSIVVDDLDRAREFYTGVLGFAADTEVELVGDALERSTGVFGARARVSGLRLGEERVELIDYLAPEGRAYPADSRSNDRWFQHVAIVVSDMDRAYAHLRAHRVRHASSGPQALPAWNTGTAGIKAFYFKDPDGHVLEVIWFPPGKGDPRWQRPTDRLFLGIDHTAIAVADTEASLGFYRDTLGLRVAGGSENFGSEQERLNNVFGARVRITTLRAAAGPGVELLEYLAPSDGRPYPVESRPNDLVSWRTIVVMPDAEATARRLREARVDWVTAGVVPSPQGVLGEGAGGTVRDPDGHAVRFTSRNDDAVPASKVGSKP
ncbi:MAG: VOC family protein [Phycisphaerae bacterium]|nr:VOC family protein [Phycisphaerae bacterium]